MSVFINGLPIFLIILIGFLSARYRLLDGSASDIVAKIVFMIVMPVTLFLDISQQSIAQTIHWSYIASYAISYIGLAIIVGLLSRFIFNASFTSASLNAMSSSHVNTAFLALPIFLLLFHKVGPVVTVMIFQAIMTFCFSSILELGTQNSQAHPLKKLSSIFLKNPVVVGILLGLIASLSGFHLPHWLLPTFEQIKFASAFLALFALGLSLFTPGVSLSSNERSQVTFLVVAKCIAHPILAYTIGRYAFELSGFELTALVLMASMPTAKLIFILSKRYHVNENTVNLVVVCTTVFSVIATNFWLWLF